MSEYISFAQIRAAMPDVLGWTEADFIRVGRQKGSLLKFIRLHNRNSPAMWRKDDVLAFMQRRYGKTAPKLVEEFTLQLNMPIARVTRPKAKAGSK